MAKPNVTDVKLLGERLHGYAFTVTVTEGDTTAEFQVWVAGSTSIEAQAGPDGPSAEWVARRFRDYPWALDNYKPLFPQLREQVAAISDDNGYLVIPSDPGDGC